MYERVCDNCGSMESHSRTRCDGCGNVIVASGVHRTSIPGVRNMIELCDDCEAAIRNAAVPLLLRCARCGHARPDHNVGCIQEGCSCVGWVDP